MKKLLTLAIVLLIAASPAFADGVGGNNPADTLLFKFVEAYKIWQAAFIDIARWVFLALATIDMVLTFGMMALKGEIEFSGVVATLIQKILIYGFFLGMLGTMEWLAQIPDSGLDIAERVNGGIAVTPDYVFVKAIELAVKIFSEMDAWSPALSLGYALVGIISFLSFLWMAVKLFITWVKICFILALAPFAFALGALGYTRSMAFNPFIILIKTTFEFVIILMVIGLVCNLVMGGEYVAKLEKNWGSLLSLLGIVFICMSVVEMSGGIIEGLFNGSIIGNSMAGLGAAKLAAAAAAGAAAGAATGGVGGVGTVKAAASLAKEQLGAGASKGAIAGQTAQNIGKALFGDFRNKMAGEVNRGTTLGRVSQELRRKKDALSKANSTPKEGK